MRLEELGEHAPHRRLEPLGHRPRNAVPPLGRTRVQVVDRVQVVVFVVPAEGAARRTCMDKIRGVAWVVFGDSEGRNYMVGVLGRGEGGKEGG